MQFESGSNQIKFLILFVGIPLSFLYLQFPLYLIA